MPFARTLQCSLTQHCTTHQNKQGADLVAICLYLGLPSASVSGPSLCQLLPGASYAKAHLPVSLYQFLHMACMIIYCATPCSSFVPVLLLPCLTINSHWLLSTMNMRDKQLIIWTTSVPAVCNLHKQTMCISWHQNAGIWDNLPCYMTHFQQHFQKTTQRKLDWQSCPVCFVCNLYIVQSAACLQTGHNIALMLLALHVCLTVHEWKQLCRRDAWVKKEEKQKSMPFDVITGALETDTTPRIGPKTLRSPPNLASFSSAMPSTAPKWCLEPKAPMLSMVWHSSCLGAGLHAGAAARPSCLWLGLLYPFLACKTALKCVFSLSVTGTTLTNPCLQNSNLSIRWWLRNPTDSLPAEQPSVWVLFHSLKTNARQAHQAQLDMYGGSLLSPTSLVLCWPTQLMPNALWSAIELFMFSLTRVADRLSDPGRCLQERSGVSLAFMFSA